MTLAYALLGLALLELLLQVLVRRLRRGFQWLVTPEDEQPLLDVETVSRYGRISFDREIGWVRRPNTRGSDQTTAGVVEFNIGSRGQRYNPDYEGKHSKVAAFGDSYCFCRLTRDDETFPHYLSRLLDTNVLNFGVGNYGLDQALLRLERELPRLESQLIIMCVVPETMARVHSYWKHYFEYGNTLAFKPRFRLQDNELELVPCVMRSIEEFASYRTKLAHVRANDPFYMLKFRGDLFRFPYLWRLVSRWRRHGAILAWLLWSKLARSPDGVRRAFSVVLDENTRTTAELYERPECRRLLRLLIARFARVCRESGRLPMLVVIPQPADLKRGDHYYGPFFREVSVDLATLDLTDVFRDHPDPDSLYVAGSLGPHVSASGNRRVAEAILEQIDRIQGEGAVTARLTPFSRKPGVSASP